MRAIISTEPFHRAHTCSPDKTEREEEVKPRDESDFRFKTFHKASAVECQNSEREEGGKLCMDGSDCKLMHDYCTEPSHRDSSHHNRDCFEGGKLRVAL